MWCAVVWSRHYAFHCSWCLEMQPTCRGLLLEAWGVCLCVLPPMCWPPVSHLPLGSHSLGHPSHTGLPFMGSGTPSTTSSWAGL